MLEAQVRDKIPFIFSTHCLQRIAERGLTVQVVLRVLNNGRWFPASKAAYRCVLGGIRVIVARNAPVVITCYQN